MAAVVRCWVGSAGRARPDAVLGRPRGSFVVAVFTEAAASAINYVDLLEFHEPLLARSIAVPDRSTGEGCAQ
jgi:hypothetical protein